jgi:hypothetical protein
MRPDKSCKKDPRNKLARRIRLTTSIAGRNPPLLLNEREIDFLELPSGALVDVIEDPNDANGTQLAICSHGRVRFTNRFEHRGQILKPISRTTNGFENVPLPRGVLGYGSATNLIFRVFHFLDHGVDVPKMYGFVLSAFVLYTWFADRLPTPVYLSLVGLPQSGKSTLLELLSMVCRRPLLVSDVSQAAIYQACSRFSPTMLFDEVDWLSWGTSSSFRQLLRSGTSHASLALRVRTRASSFGAKVFSSLESSPDSALNSRCIQVPMAETTKQGLLKPRDPRMKQVADELQMQLLNYRFRTFGKICPAVIPGSETLRPRSKDLLGTLAAPLKTYRLWNKLLLGFFKEYQDPLTRESLDAKHDAILAVLFETIRRYPNLQSIRITDIRQIANTLLAKRGERISLSDKAAGSAISALGFGNKQRTNIGWILSLDSSTVERIHQLVKTFGSKCLESET